MLKKLFLGLAALCVSLSSALATPPNTTATNAVSYETDQGWVSHFFDQSVQSRWFKITTVGGRSYCIEAAQGSDSAIALNPNVTYFFDAAGTTQVSTNNDGNFQPAMTTGSRLCFADTNALDTRTVRTIRLNVPIVAGSGDSGFMRFRVYDTTVVGAVSWNLASGESTNGQFIFHNITGTPITVHYQMSGSCTPSPWACDAGAPGSFVVPPRAASGLAPGVAGTYGWRFVSFAIAAPASNLRVYRIDGQIQEITSLSR